MRMAENEKITDADLGSAPWPPDPIGQVRVRLLTDTAVADLRGATTCEILDPSEVQEILDRLGPDPLVDRPAVGERRFIERASKTARSIALVLMDQEVVSGIGNVYRAELLYRARLNPFTPAKDVPIDTLRAIWKDWVKLLRIGVETGQMMTMDRLGPKRYAAAMASRDDRHWVYHRTGLPCRVCGTPIMMQELATRKLYWCPYCQA
jgi:formamidopyrimidine-DNA glycosylase